MVQSGIVPLDELPYEEKQEIDVLGPGLELNIAFPATLSAPVLSLLMGTEEKVLNPSSIRKLERYTTTLAP